MKYKVKDFVSNISPHVKLDDVLSKALDVMSEYNLKKITVVDNNNIIYATLSKRDLFKFIKSREDRYKLSVLKMRDILDENTYSIVLYPQNNLYNVCSVMNSLDLSCLPVAKSPWHKELIGHIYQKEINKVLEEEAKCSLIF